MPRQSVLKKTLSTRQAKSWGTVKRCGLNLCQWRGSPSSATAKASRATAAGDLLVTLMPAGVPPPGAPRYRTCAEQEGFSTEHMPPLFSSGKFLC